MHQLAFTNILCDWNVSRYTTCGDTWNDKKCPIPNTHETDGRLKKTCNDECREGGPKRRRGQAGSAVDRYTRYRTLVSGNKLIGWRNTGNIAGLMKEMQCRCGWKTGEKHRNQGISQFSSDSTTTGLHLSRHHLCRNALSTLACSQVC